MHKIQIPFRTVFLQIVIYAARKEHKHTSVSVVKNNEYVIKGINLLRFYWRFYRNSWLFLSYSGMLDNKVPIVCLQ